MNMKTLSATSAYILNFNNQEVIINDIIPLVIQLRTYSCLPPVYEKTKIE